MSWTRIKVSDLTYTDKTPGLPAKTFSLSALSLCKQLLPEVRLLGLLDRYRLLIKVEGRCYRPRQDRNLVKFLKHVEPAAKEFLAAVQVPLPGAASASPPAAG